jgi:hypothetical protein
MIERKTEEFETDEGKWKIYFDIEKDHERGNSNILVSFIVNRKNQVYLTKEDIEELKNDLKDLRKLRIIKQGKNFLEK